MLFNSYEFVLLFLPATLLVFRQLSCRARHSLALHWLILASLAFYGWKTPGHLLLLLVSMLCNYTISHILVARQNPHWRNLWLTLGVVANLLPLLWFKYAGFALQNLQAVGLIEITTWQNPGLPLAISFFTFQQIAFLADTHRQGEAHRNLAEYIFCVVFFPHLIAGPLVYYREFLQQLHEGKLRTPIIDDTVRGLALFTLGLAKKVLIGDNLGQLINPLFDGDQGPSGAFDAWAGGILYGFQIYFDFSAYSDMAIGLACLFGLRLPLNFDSPYQATSYRDFFRRWHITLFRFFRDHVFLPLQGDSESRSRRFLLTFLVFFLSGIWHGAAWTFVVWGVANWALVVLNDWWIKLANAMGVLSRCPRYLATLSGRLFVLLAMSSTITVFRAHDFTQVQHFLQQAMAPANLHNSVVLSTLENSSAFTAFISPTALSPLLCLILLCVTLLSLLWHTPCAVRLILGHENAYQLPTNSTLSFRFSTGWCAYLALALWAALLALPQATRFIYFQF